MKNQFTAVSRLGLATFALVGLCGGGLAFGQKKADDSAGASPSPAHAATMKAEKKDKMAKDKMTSSLDRMDRDFMMEAAKGGVEEVEMGKMAEQKGQSAEVKNFGKMMVTDHSKANKELMALAKKKGVTLDTSHKMEKMADARFDHEYMEEMVKDHKKDIAAFEKEAKNGKDADVKKWAADTLPTLKKHLKAAEDAQKMMKKS